MKSFPPPVLIAALGALIALPFSGAASFLLGFTAGFGAIINLDYPRRYRGLRVPRRARFSAAIFRAPPLACEPNRLAA